MDTILYSAISGIAGIVIGAVIDHVLYGSKAVSYTHLTLPTN